MAKLIVINDKQLRNKPYVVASSSLDTIKDNTHFSEADYDYYSHLGAEYAEHIKIRPNTQVVYLLIQGKSFFEDQQVFYQAITSKILSWVLEDKYIVLIFKLDFMNSSSRKCLIIMITTIIQETEKFNVFWIPVEDEMEEEGHDLKEILTNPNYFIV